MATIKLTTFSDPDDYTNPLAIVNAGEYSVRSALFAEDHGEEIAQNLVGKSTFYQSYLSGTYFIMDIPGYTMSGEYNKLSVSPYAIFSDSMYLDSDNLEPLPYKYILKYDHLARSQNPFTSIRLFDQNFKEVPKNYYELQYTESTRCGTLAVSGSGNTYGPFVLQRSQIDAQKVRAAQGKNIWGNDWSASAIRERQIWEFENPELRRPPTSGDYGVDEIAGLWNRADDGRFSESEFDNFYISQAGSWGQYLSGEVVWYETANGAKYERGPGISGTAAAVQQIGTIQSQKYLGGDEYTAADVPYTITVLLPEFLCHQDGFTLWVEYTKYLSYFDVDGTFFESVSPGYKEIVNPSLLMREDSEYNLVRGDDFWHITLSGAFEAEHPTDVLYIKESKDKIINFNVRNSGTKEAWFPQISEGYFKIGSTWYSSWRMIQAMGHAVDWKDHNPSGDYVAPNAVLADDGYYCGKVVKEQADVISSNTIRVAKTPLFFWSGPRDRDDRNNFYGYPIKTDAPVYDFSGLYDPENPWPRYIPPNLLDFEDDYGFYDYPTYNPYVWPGYSHGITIYRNKQLFDNSNIETYDLWNGLIVFNITINPDDLFEVTYLYEQRAAVIPNVNLNPLYPEQLNDPNVEFVEA